MAPLTHRAPVTHHRTVVVACHWWEETKFPAGINLVQTVAPGWRQIESEMALDLITIPAVSALPQYEVPFAHIDGTWWSLRDLDCQCHESVTLEVQLLGSLETQCVRTRSLGSTLVEPTQREPGLLALSVW